MADDKNAREDQAQNAERRQREREIAAAVERGDEPEPPVDEAELGDLEADLEPLSFPATGADVVAAVGDREIESPGGTYAVEELVPDTDVETFGALADVWVRVQRPTIAVAMKRVIEAGVTVPDIDPHGSQPDAYEKTFRALKAIDADDDDEGIQVIADWIVEQVHEKRKLPGSRAVRREAATFCRANGYQVRNDEWLGV
ncbi:MAG: hypothetical protein ABEH66_06350 [Halobacteriales archaeon]